LFTLVLLTAFATAASAQAPKSAAGGRTANLPDFTVLMKQQGPAVVNVITKREPAKTARAPQEVTRGRLGVRIQPMTKELAQSFKLKEPNGALIATVEPGSPADKAGLKAGDVVLAFNGQAIDDPSKLPRLVAATKPGQSATLKIWRDAKAEEVKFTAAELVAENRAAKPTPDKATKPNRLGLVVSELPPAQRRALGIDCGVVVESADASRTPLRPGDVIVGVGRESFKRLEDFNRLIGEPKPGDTVALLVRRGEATVYVPVEVGDGKVG
jgi:serine protease Do